MIARLLHIENARKTQWEPSSQIITTVKSPSKFTPLPTNDYPTFAHRKMLERGNVPAILMLEILLKIILDSDNFFNKHLER